MPIGYLPHQRPQRQLCQKSVPMTEKCWAESPKRKPNVARCKCIWLTFVGGGRYSGNDVWVAGSGGRSCSRSLQATVCSCEPLPWRSYTVTCGQTHVAGTSRTSRA